MVALTCHNLGIFVAYTLSPFSLVASGRDLLLPIVLPYSPLLNYLYLHFPLQSILPL